METVVEWEDQTARLALERDEKRKADDNFRLRSALDKCQTNVMVANGNYDIVYMNDTMLDMMRGAEGQLRTALPALDANKLIGTNIDDFPQEPIASSATCWTV